jgi:hypothetical protein
MKIDKPTDGNEPLPDNIAFVAYHWKKHDKYQCIEIARIHKRVECRMIVSPLNPAMLVDTLALMQDEVFHGADWELTTQNFMLTPYDSGRMFVVWYFNMKES